MDMNQAAFPVSDGRDVDWGMTLRDYFAGQALAGGLLQGASRLARKDIKSDDVRAIMAREAYDIADAMLAARSASDPDDDLARQMHVDA